MKREQFSITCNNELIATKSAWNASIRHIEAIVRTIAKNEDCTYTLAYGETHKEGFYYVSGRRHWTSNKGTVLMFSVVKL
jgi:hypothetical protein